MRDVSVTWRIAGGWAIELFVGRSVRDHSDLEIGCFRPDVEEEAIARRPEALRHNALPLRERIRLAVEWHLAVHAANPALHQALTACTPEILGVDAIRTFERMVQQTIRHVLEQHKEELRPRNLDIASFFSGSEPGVPHPWGGRALS